MGRIKGRKNYKTILKMMYIAQPLEDGGFCISKKFTREIAFVLIKEAQKRWYGMELEEGPTSPLDLKVAYVRRAELEEYRYHEWEWVIESNGNRNGSGDDAVWVYWA